MSNFNEAINESASPVHSPITVDGTGETYQRPPAWRARLFCFAFVALIALGVFLYLQGLFSIGIALITVCLAALAILAIYARTSLSRIFGHQTEHYSTSPLGRYLAADKQDIESENPLLTDDEADALDLHRATEAVLVNEWVVNARTPRRIQVRSDDGTSLAGRMVPGTKRERPWVLMLHGFGGTWRDSLAFSRIYAAHDCNIMFVDMRSHGESEGDWAGLGWLDRRDVVAWCSWITARTGEDAQIIIHGQGMGATAALFAAAENDFPPQVRAIVSDSAYVDTWNQAALRVGSGFAKPEPLLDLYRATLKKAAGGYDLAEANVLPLLANVGTPLFIMQGEKDLATPPYMGIYLAKAAGCDTDSIVESITANVVMGEIATFKEEAAVKAAELAKDAASPSAQEPHEKPHAEEEPASKEAATEAFEPIAEPALDELDEQEHDSTQDQEATQELLGDDLSDLFDGNEPDANEYEEDSSSTVPEALPHIAQSNTGNVFLFSPGAGHCQTPFACPTAYENMLNEFLNRCIG